MMKKENLISIIIILCISPIIIKVFLTGVALDFDIYLSDQTMLYLCVGIIAVLIVGLIWVYYSNVNYMENQKTTGSDKAMLLRRMAEEMGERYEDYTYVTAYVIQTSHRRNTINSPYEYYPRQPYVIAFNDSETVIYRFQVRQGVIQLFPRLDINWASSSWKYHIGEDRIELVISNSPSTLGIAEVSPLVGTKYVIDKVLHSAHNKMIAWHPLGIYQENEFWRFVKCLAGYPNSQSY